MNFFSSLCDGDPESGLRNTKSEVAVEKSNLQEKERDQYESEIKLGWRHGF
jgi:hypothetical protein